MVAAASSDPQPPCPSVVVQQPTEIALPTPSQLSFPDEFPYEFDSTTFSSAFTSPGDSAEEDETSDDEDDFLAGLNRRLALSTQRLPSPLSKAEVKPANSPESTLTSSGNVSPSVPSPQVPSPPPTSLSHEEDTVKVITAAAGEVAKIKMANFDAKPDSRRPNPNPNSFAPFPQNASFCGYYYYYWLWQPQGSHFHQSPIRMESTLQPALTVPSYPVRGVCAASTAVKPPSAGTGVFLPRKYPNPSNSQKKSSGGRCAKLPTKVVQQQSRKTEESSGRCQAHSQVRPSKGRNKIDYVAGGCLKEEKHLPQEWKY